LGKNYNLVVDINGVAPSTTRRRLISLTFTIKSSNEETKFMTPVSVSPVLRTNINFTLDSNFPFTLKGDDFEVDFISRSNNTYIRKSRVVEVYDAQKIITVKFGGAISQNFDVQITHKQFGRIDTKGNMLTVGSNTTSIVPMTGSIYGGTMVTIKGTNFGTTATDNPVELFRLGEKSVKCFV